MNMYRKSKYVKSPPNIQAQQDSDALSTRPRCRTHTAAPCRPQPPRRPPPPEGWVDEHLVERAPVVLGAGRPNGPPLRRRRLEAVAPQQAPHLRHDRKVSALYHSLPRSIEECTLRESLLEKSLQYALIVQCTVRRVYST